MTYSYEEWTAGGELIDLTDGKLWYRHKGGGLPVLMGHFWGGESWWYSRVFDAFAEHFSVYAFDLPGCGQSDVPPLVYGPAQFSNALIEFMNKLGIDRAHFLCSHGSGLNAMHIAASRPTRVARIVVDGYPAWNDSEGRQLFHETMGHTWMTEDGSIAPFDEWGGLTSGEYDPFPSMQAEERDTCIQRVTDGYMKHPHWGASIIREALKYDGFKRLPLVQSPALCIYGEQDWGGAPVPNGESPLRRLLHGLTGAEATTIPDAGLVPMFEQPAEWTRLALEFLRRGG